MKKILISIQPKWAEKILNGKKTIEVRKTAPKEVPFKAYIYCTKPKSIIKYSKCWGGYTDMLYRLPDGEIKFGDSIGLMAYDDYTSDNFLNGKVVGEFVCNEVDEIACKYVPYTNYNNLGYEKSIDNGVYRIGNTLGGIVFEKNDKYLDTMLKNLELEKMCITLKELYDYLKTKTGYAWHISDLKVYDKPRELSEFTGTCKTNKRCGESKICNGPQQCLWDNLTRPPQSWMYVEDIK